MRPSEILTRLSRRGMLLGLAAAGAVMASRVPAWADAASTAKTLVTALGQDLIQLVNAGRSPAQIYPAFERIFAQYADMPAIAASVLGPPWRTATQAQKQSFVAGFQSYMAHKYGKQFEDYKNASITVGGAKDGGKAGILVQTKVARPGQDDIAVDWQVSDRSGAAKVVNLIIEGVSMLANERAEIGAMLEAQKGSIDGLTAQLNAAT